MLLRSIITRSMAVTSLLVLSSLAQAGVQATVTVGPFAAPPISAAPVPTLSGYLLIVLGLLLAVIAFRTLRNNRGAQKILSVLVLGGGLIISGIGVDRTLATPQTVSAQGAVCNADGPINYFPGGSRALQNLCNNSIEIKGFSSGCTFGLDTANANCKQGQVLREGESCSYLPQCNNPPG
jgi:hypothetical protein